MNPTGEIILGIDLGTTNSVAAFYDADGVHFIKNELGHHLTPSAVAVDQERQGELRIGRVAKDLLARNPAAGARKFKTNMGHDHTYAFPGHKLGSIELSSLVLKSLKADAERELGRPVYRAVITVPAYFSEAQRQATRKAGELAGLNVERILNEPTAAAISYGLQKREDVHRFLVFDLGGGTFDVCVMQLDEGILEVLSVAGISQLGGEDFTNELLDKLLADEGLTYDQIFAADPENAGLLLKRAELLKQRLSSSESEIFRLPEIPALNFQSKEVSVSRERLNEIFEPLLKKLAGPCQTALRGSRTSVSELDAVVLVGGATRMPCVREFIEDYFETESLGIVDPDLVVAQGAAIQAALYAENEAVEDLVVTDVLSHSLGIAVSKHVANKLVDGFFAPIIHRNTVIPSTRSEIFSPIVPGQTVIDVQIFEGESRFTKENRKLGRLKVRGIPRNPTENAVEIRFSYDLDGILEVEATVLHTGRKVSRILSRDLRALSDSELKAAEQRLLRIKFDYRDDDRVRALMLRAENLLRDLPAEERRYLEGYLDQFDRALEVRDRNEIESLFAEIKALCDAHGPEEHW